MTMPATTAPTVSHPPCACGGRSSWDAVKGWVCTSCHQVVAARRVRWSEDRAAWKRQYNREHRQGIRRTAGKRPVELRLMARLDRDPGELVVPALGPCWVWRGARNADGYGVIRGDAGELVLVHRVALAFALGRPIAAGMLACHRCDYPRCARPAHLYEGSPTENLTDQYTRRRRPPRAQEATA